MKTIIGALLAFVSTMFRSRATLQFEIVALRHQLTVYQRTIQRPRINPGECESVVLLPLSASDGKQTGGPGASGNARMGQEDR